MPLAALLLSLPPVQPDALAADHAAMLAPMAQPISSGRATPPSVADADIREYVAIIARKEAGKQSFGGIGPADKLIVIARSRTDFPEVLGSAGIPQRQQLMPPPEGSVALVRFRQSRDPVLPGPSKADLDYAQTHKLPLFVIGEWSRALPMWEVAWTGSRVEYRSIGDTGEIGPWQD